MLVLGLCKSCSGCGWCWLVVIIVAVIVMVVAVGRRNCCWAVEDIVVVLAFSVKPMSDGCLGQRESCYSC